MKRLADSDWLAGFIDGEGCFTFAHDTLARGQKTYRPRFTIGLRGDDLPILEELQCAFGGSINFGHYGSEVHPLAQWHVLSKDDLLTLVGYLDEHPLRAKKARDYAIWRRGVHVYVNASASAPELPALAEALRATRAYNCDVVVEPEESPQLRLVEEVL